MAWLLACSILVFSQLSGSYQALSYLQMLFCLGLVEVPSAPGVQASLQGYHLIALPFLPNPLPAPSHREPSTWPFYNSTYDSNYYRNCGPFLSLYILLFAGIVAFRLALWACERIGWQPQWLKKIYEICLYRLTVDLLMVTAPFQVLFSVMQLRRGGSAQIAAGIALGLTIISIFILGRVFWKRGHFLRQTYKHLRFLTGESQLGRWFYFLVLVRAVVQCALTALLGGYPLYLLPLLVIMSLSNCSLLLRFKPNSLALANHAACFA
jgi:hypothetical protein